MTWTRRRLLAAAGASGVAVAAHRFWTDDHLLCPEPATPTWTFDRTVKGHELTGRFWGPLVHRDGRAFATSGHGIAGGSGGAPTQIVAVDPATGTAIWTREPDDTGFGTPLVHGSDLFVPSGENALLALDVESGDTRWRFDAGVRDGIEHLSYALDRPVVADGGDVVVQSFVRPTLDDRSSDAAVVGVERADGSVRWTVEATERSRVVRVADEVFSVVADGRVLRVDPVTGDERVWMEFDVDVLHAVSTTDRDRAVVVLEDGTVFALDRSIGFERWGQVVSRDATTLDPNVALVADVASVDDAPLAVSPAGVVTRHAHRTGSHRWRYDVNVPVHAIDANATTGRAVAVDARGFCHVLDVETGERVGRFATATSDSGETCGLRVRAERMVHATVHEGTTYISDGQVRAFDLENEDG